jgi:hypothetical protein
MRIHAIRYQQKWYVMHSKDWPESEDTKGRVTGTHLMLGGEMRKIEAKKRI